MVQLTVSPSFEDLSRDSAHGAMKTVLVRTSILPRAHGLGCFGSYRAIFPRPGRLMFVMRPHGASIASPHWIPFAPRASISFLKSGHIRWRSFSDAGWTAASALGSSKISQP